MEPSKNETELVSRAKGLNDVTRENLKKLLDYRLASLAETCQVKIEYQEKHGKEWIEYKVDTGWMVDVIGYNVDEFGNVWKPIAYEFLIVTRWKNMMFSLWERINIALSHPESIVQPANTKVMGVATAARGEEIRELAGIDPAVWKTEPGKVAGSKSEGSGV